MTNGTINDCSGNFKDPGNNGQYANNSNFTQTICSSIAGQCVSLTFTSFNIESGFDFLYVYDGATATQNLIGVYTGTTLPGTLTSSNGCLTFFFTSDGTVTAPGWVATISCGPCNSSQGYVMSGTPIVACNGTFYDPGGSGDYPNGVTYTQTICSGTAGQCVSLFFSQFDIESGYDFLTIYDGPSTASTLIGTYTGTTSPGSVTATSGCITLVFTSDFIFEYPGWVASISCGTCGGGGGGNCGCPAGGTPPVNDNCSGAINLGPLPTPAACPSGAGGAVTFQGTNNCATAPANFASQLGCQPAGNQPWPAADVWYQITVTGTELHIMIPGGGMQSPSVALYQGINCNNLIPRGCAIGNAAGLNTTFAPVQPGTYWLQVSGGNLNDQCDFSMTIWNNLDCNGCVLASTLSVNPPPVNGYYQPNTPVTFCFTITNYNQTSFNWLHGVVPTFGAGWNLASLTNVPAANCTADDAGLFWNNAPGVWSWYNSVTSTATGATYGPGFFFEQSQPIGFVDGNPGNSYGDNGSINATNTSVCTWTFCWTITTQPTCNAGADLSIDINTLGDGESGGWASVGCTLDPNSTFNALMQCCLPPSIITSDPTCSQNNGSASALGDGIGPWTYEWFDAGSNLLQTDLAVNGSSSIGNLLAGSYYVIVTDAQGCSTLSNFSLLPSSTLNLSTIQSNISCSGSSNGSINLTVSSLSPPFTYLWSNGITTEDLSNLALGIYTVTVTDATGCTGVVSATITQQLGITLILTPTNVACNGGNSGNITSLVNGGTAPFTYLWSNASTASSISSLSIGTYTLTVTDVNGCTASASSTLTQPPINIVTLESEDITCGRDNGEAAVDNITGGGGPFTYIWNTGETTIQIEDLIPGTYSVTVTNAGGCTSTASVTLGSISFPILSETHINTTCGSANGSIDISVAGGVASFTYLWSGGQTSQDLTFIGAGSYTVTVTDDNGCTATLPITITDAPAQTLTETHTDATCGLSNGTAGVIVSGGTPGYTYLWSTSATTANIAGLSVGNYTVTVTDFNGCTATIAASVSNIGNPVTSTTNTTICVNQLPYTWNANSYAAAGTYSVTLTSAAGCDSVATLNLTVNPNVTSTTNTTICVNQLPYTWNANSYASAGTYNVTMTSAAGCDSVATLNLSVNPNVTSTTNTTICVNQLPYTWNANSYAAAGTYSVTLTSAAGCDSVATLNLTVNQIGRASCRERC